MSKQRKRQFRFATFVLVSAILAIAALAPAFLSDEASALNASKGEWEKVRDYLHKYIASQYQYGPDGKANTADDPAQGEAGFIMDQENLKTRLDNNKPGGDNVYLGEGDDAKNAPVLVDNFYAADNVIPGTGVRCNWNGDPADAASCLSADRVNTVKNRVTAHQEAGFSTDVVFYCMTGHTEAPTTGAFGYIAQTGGLGKGAYPNAPKVYAFKWGRSGWTNTSKTYGNDNAVGGAGNKSRYADASQAQCTGFVTDAELVRCVAGWAISSSGGNVSNGVNPPLGDVQPVDIRAPSPGTTISNTGFAATIQIPVKDLFNTGINNLDSAGKKKIFASRTQHLAGIVAIGAEMLGYDSGFLQWGMPNWKSSLDEKWVSTGVAYPTLAATKNDVNSGVDKAAPAASKVEALNITGTSAKIHRVANEPASMKIQYGTSPSALSSTKNDTVLNANKTVQLTGLKANTRYYYKVTSYDGQANGAASAVQSFWTDVTPPTVKYVGPSGTVNVNNPRVTATASDAGSGLASATLKLNGGAPSPCAVSGSNISCATKNLVDGKHTALVSVTDRNGNTGKASGSFTVAAGPTIEASVAKIYWEDSAAAYQYNAAGDQYYGDLSVDYKLTDTGPADALNTTVANTTVTEADPPEQKNNITVLPGQLPKNLGNINRNGGFKSFTVKYRIPVDRDTRQPMVRGFKTKITARWSDSLGNKYENNNLLQGPPPPPPPPCACPIQQKDYYSTWYNFGNANAGYFVFDPVAKYAPARKWGSGPGRWDLSHSKIASGDFNGDGKLDQAIFYDYGKANTGLWIYYSGAPRPVRKWLSGAGNWELSRSKVTAADLNRDGKDEVLVLYNYDNANVGLWSFGPTPAGTSSGIGNPYTAVKKWQSGPGNWDWFRSQVSYGDGNGDGKTDLVMLYNYGNANTGLFIYEAGKPRLKWLSGQNNWDWSRSKIMSGDLDNDGKDEVGVLYNYGNANTGLFSFEPFSGEPQIPANSPCAYPPCTAYYAKLEWLSGPGKWDWSRTKKAAVNDANGDGRTELGVLYKHGNSSTGLYIFGWNGSSLAPARVWMGNPGSWDWSRSRVG